MKAKAVLIAALFAVCFGGAFAQQRAGRSLLRPRQQRQDVANQDERCLSEQGVPGVTAPLIPFDEKYKIKYEDAVERVLELSPHVELVSDEEANFFTAIIYRQYATASIKPVDAHPNCPINPSYCPINPSDCPINPPDCPINPPDCPINDDSVVSKDIIPAARILEVVRGNPGISKKGISTALGISERNVKFHIEHSLRGKVEFRGAKRTGGYHVVEKT